MVNYEAVWSLLCEVVYLLPPHKWERIMTFLIFLTKKKREQKGEKDHNRSDGVYIYDGPLCCALQKRILVWGDPIKINQQESLP